MSDKQKILTEADEAYSELQEAIAGLDDAEMNRVWLGSWGVREILVHAAAWDQEMAPAFGRIGRGEEPYAAGAYDDADAWNARFVERKKGAKPSEALADLEASHRRLVAAATALGAEHFSEGAPARALLEGTGAQHYREHAAQIRQWRRGGR